MRGSDSGEDSGQAESITRSKRQPGDFAAWTRQAQRLLQLGQRRSFRAAVQVTHSALPADGNLSAAAETTQNADTDVRGQDVRILSSVRTDAAMNTGAAQGCNCSLCWRLVLTWYMSATGAASGDKDSSQPSPSCHRAHCSSSHRPSRATAALGVHIQSAKVWRAPQVAAALGQGPQARRWSHLVSILKTCCLCLLIAPLDDSVLMQLLGRWVWDAAPVQPSTYHDASMHGLCSGCCAKPDC